MKDNTVAALVVTLSACFALAGVQPVRADGRTQSRAFTDASAGLTALVLESAPIFDVPDPSHQPMRVAKEGSRLRVVGQTAEWCTVQFQDPQFGVRTGYVQTRFVRLEARPQQSEPVDVSMPAFSNQARNGQLPERPLPSSGRTSHFAETGSKSTSSGFFVGVGYEGNAIVGNDVGLNSATESGRGVGIVLGYGFNPRWSLYGTLSGANINSVDFGETYGLGHFDLGTRIHFLAGPSRVVPFVQGGLAGRAVSQEFTIGSRTFKRSASGAGVEFGGGLNAHFTPAFAFSGGVTWMVGNFSTYQVNGQNVGGDSVSATSARIHVGVIWWTRH